MDMQDGIEHSLEFSQLVERVKSSSPAFPWYPFTTLMNVQHFANFSGAGKDIFSHVGPGKTVADIGAADGDMAFFLEGLGADVTIVDWPQTNFNDCRGILQLRATLNKKAHLHFVDLEWAPWLPGNFDLIMFLGILYHLRNPGLVLNTLAHCAERLVVSTMVFFRLENGIEVADQQLGYFLERREIGDDPTNYWLFTPQALRILLRRSGWNVVDEFMLGDVATATPTKGDCRMFCYCERVPAWRDLRVHHDF